MRLAVTTGLAALAALLPLAAGAFPEGVTTPDAATITRLVGDRVFDATLASGVRWRLEYNPRGHFFFDASNGLRIKGAWRTEDGRLCTSSDPGGDNCSEIRMRGSEIFLKRVSNGEILKLVPR